MRLRGESGQAGGLEALAFGLLVFVLGTLLISNVWAVIDAKFATSASAREAVRVFVEAPNAAAAAGRAEIAAREALSGHGRDTGRMSTSSQGRFARCQPVTYEVTYRVPTLSLPFIGGLGKGIIRVSSEHTEIVDPFRSGLEGEGDCASTG
jgi:hypothetical protein